MLILLAVRRIQPATLSYDGLNNEVLINHKEDANGYACSFYTDHAVKHRGKYRCAACLKDAAPEPLLSSPWHPVMIHQHSYL